MKYIIVILFLILPIVGMGQDKNLEKTDSLTKNVLTNLFDYWNLGVNDDITQPVNIRIFNKYKTLFDSTAQVDDDFNVHFEYNTQLKKSEYKLDTAKPFDVYGHDVALETSYLSIDSVGVAEKESSNMNGVTYKVYRKVTAQKLRKFVLEDPETYFDNEFAFRNLSLTDSQKVVVANNSLYHSPSVYKIQSQSYLLITLKLINDSTIKISKIAREEKSSSFIIFDDNDFDGILNSEDSCKTYGDFTANGCPDFDFDGVPNDIDNCDEIYGSPMNKGCPSNYFNNKFSVAVYTGALLNSCPIDLPDAKTLGYKSVDNSLSQNGSFKNPGLIFSPVFGADFSYYFGKKVKPFGISIGIFYSQFYALFEVNDNAVYTYKETDGENDYRRRVTLKGGSIEDIDYQVFNFPLLFKYRHKRDNSTKPVLWSYEVSGGPSLIYYMNTSNYDVNIDFEGLYQILDGDFVYETYDSNSSYNLLLTANNINNQAINPGVDSVFNQLNNNGYDFASDKNYYGVDKSNRMSIAVNLNFDLCYAAKDNMDIKFGAGFTASKLLSSSSNYTPMKNTSDNYNSYFRSDFNSIYTSYGLHIGLVFSW